MRLLLALAISVLFAMPAVAGVWQSNCAICHNGSIAKSTLETLKAKFKTKEEFIKAAKTINNPAMASVQGNPDLIKKAADSVYGK